MKKIINVLAGIIILGITAFAPITRHVSMSGNDQNPCTQSSPCRTIQHTINVAGVGDLISIEAGVYNEAININKAVTVSCLELRKCVIKKATLSGGAVIDGFHVTDSSGSTPQIVANAAKDCAITNNLINHVNSAAISVSGTNCYIANNEITPGRPYPSGTSDRDGIRFFGSGHKIIGNYIHGMFFKDIGGDPHIDCLQTWGGASDILIENNICDNYDAKTGGANNGTQGANLENCDGCVFNRNYFHVYGKGILWEESSTNGKADNNIFVSGPKIAGSTSGQYCMFGNAKVNGNVCYLYTSVLVGGASGSGNVTTNPQMSGYCSQAFPSKGVPCATGGTVVPPTQTSVVIPSVTRTPTVAPSATKTPTPSQIPTLRTPTKTVTPTFSPIPPTATQTGLPVASATFTPSVTPTSTPTPPAPVCKWLGWSRFWEWLRCLRG